MSAADIIREAETLMMQEKLTVMRQWLAQLGEDSRQRKTAERFLCRLEHPEVPEEVWEGFPRLIDFNPTLHISEASVGQGGNWPTDN